MKQEKNFTVKILQSFANIQDSKLAARIYDGNIGYFTEDGIISEKDSYSGRIKERIKGR